MKERTLLIYGCLGRVGKIFCVQLRVDQTNIGEVK